MWSFIPRQPEIPQNTESIGGICMAMDATLHSIRHKRQTTLRRAGPDYRHTRKPGILIYVRITILQYHSFQFRASRPQSFC